ncbi:MAG TPA: CBU_0585 family protein [Gammaproteobacteria bacterium]|nr:CBU_0585 family protein [Gammaproteobacteria bacterium]
MMKHSKKNTNFVSNIDLYLAEFDRTHAFSASQQAEIAKYQRVYALRDQPLTAAEAKDLADGSV